MKLGRYPDCLLLFKCFSEILFLEVYSYDSLKTFFVKKPSEEIRRQLIKVGKKLRKDENQVEADIQTAVAENSKLIKDFSLARYDQNKNVSIANYRGKVVLLNFWYPLCGPCHGEAPFIQKLIDK